MLRKICSVLGISRLELAEKLGLSKTTIDSWSDSSRISKTAQLAMELMIENHKLRCSIKNFQESFRSLNLNSFDNNKNYIMIDLAKRIEYIMNEYELNDITCSKIMGEPSFEKINKILNLDIYPDFDFLDKFAKMFHINDNWLLTGKDFPFRVEFIKSRFNSQLMKEAEGFSKIYIITCSNNNKYTKILAMNFDNQYDFYHVDFCIGNNFHMEARESSDLYDLFKFFNNFRANISVLEFNEEDYKKLVSRQFYPKNILKHGSISYMLLDLLDLRYDMEEQYDSFFRKCIQIIKKEKELLEKNNKE
ncbi:helix-turn-helix domain containing protein [Campylobacter sp. RKI_CA19_01128]|uniref:helix-turn-helix domain containing protein n=1 Tax=unclassified Campylobacter TaxID=2593542 RepID=UPI0021E73DEA|nr:MULTISPECIES: helix-turn-helix domain containing protein [unclassified Campylobacter]MCV3349641.1 helix-turn-helix domain containing protein [Campylobacter sp. RKI_CA19_01127]MCV3355654.1 helix-turn-helix domain containing protein [Campylobacter sp. RKI_CA19_01128]HEC1777077.1 transcriptional regulator [Campylobacter lari]